MRVVKVQHEGKLVDAEALDFKTDSSEPWTEYALSDGTTIRLRTFMVTAFRLINERGPDGSPIYLFQHQTIQNVQVGSHLTQEA